MGTSATILGALSNRSSVELLAFRTTQGIQYLVDCSPENEVEMLPDPLVADINYIAKTPNDILIYDGSCTGPELTGRG